MKYALLKEDLLGNIFDIFLNFVEFYRLATTFIIATQTIAQLDFWALATVVHVKMPTPVHSKTTEMSGVTAIQIITATDAPVSWLSR